MATIDERVVSMKFDNSGFSSGVKDTMSWLDKLRGALKLSGGVQGFDEISRAAGSGLNMGVLSSQIDNINSKFTGLGAVATGALMQIGGKVAQVGEKIISSFSTDGIVDGFKEYETKMGSIQTIYANTHERYGTDYSEIEASLDELNKYADQTIYSFGDMTKNIGLFTNAGLGVKESTSMIKGFSNAAAASGTSAERASGAAYQLSQGLAAGRITLEDWNSLTNAGMGNANMKEGLVDIAHAMGTLDKGTMATADSINSDFRESLKDGWITTDVMSKYLQIMSGDMDDAGMAAIGLSKDQIEAFKRQAKIGEDSATQIRTLSQLIGTAREEIGSGWSQTIEILFGNFSQATELFTKLGGKITGFIGDINKKRNDLLQGWSDMGGRDKLIESLAHIFEQAGKVIQPVFSGLKEAIGTLDVEDLMRITNAFHDFVMSINIPPEVINILKSIGYIVGTVFKMGIEIVGGLTKAFFSLFGALGNVDPSSLTKLQDMFMRAAEAMRHFHDDVFGEFLKNMSGFPRIISNIISKIVDAFSGLFSTGDVSKFSDDLGSVSDGLGTFGDRLKDIGGGIGNAAVKVITGIGDAIKHVWDFIGPGLSSLGDTVSKGFHDLFSNINYDQSLDLINTGLLGGIFLLFKQFFGGGLIDQLKGILGGGESGIISTIKGTFGQLTDTLSAMQNQLETKTLLQIAGAVAVLTASVVALSLIDSASLTKALVAITIMFVQLGGAMAAFDKIGGWGMGPKLAGIGAGLILLSGAILVLTASVAILGSMDLDTLGQGLLGLTAILAILVGAMSVMPAPKGLIKVGLALVPLATGITILTAAVGMLGSMDLASLAKGLGGIALVLGALALFTKFVEADKVGISSGAGIMLMAAGLMAISAAIGIIGSLSVSTIVKGLVGIAASLGILVGAINLLPKNTLAQSTGVLILAGAMNVLASALVIIGLMGWDNLAKGLIGLGLGLAELVIAVNMMDGAVAGAAAMLIVSAAIVAITGSFVMFATLDWSTITMALIALGGALAIMLTAGLLAEGVAPGLLALSISLTAFGIAVALAGVGVGALAVGISLLISAIINLVNLGVSGIQQLGDMVPGIITLIQNVITGVLNMIIAVAPLLFQAISTIVQGIIKVLSDNLPAVVNLFSQILQSVLILINNNIPLLVHTGVNIIMALLNGISIVVPQVIRTILNLIQALLNAIVSAVGMFVDAGMRLIVGILRGIANNIGSVVDAGADIIWNFLDGIERNMGRLADKGAETILTFIRSLNNAIDRYGPQIASESRTLGVHLLNGLTNGLFSKINDALGAVRNAGSRILNSFKNALGIHSPSKYTKQYGRYLMEGLRIGTEKNTDSAVDAAFNASGSVLSAMQKALEDDLALRPTVKPIMDLTEANKGLDDITSSISASTSASIASGISSPVSDQGGVSKETVINFTQNNMSPESLSPAEIYRNTKSQLERVRRNGVI